MESHSERFEGSRRVWIRNERMPKFLSRHVRMTAMWSGIVFPDDVVIAYDGKISGRMVRWGVGVQDLRNGVGHYVGGRWQDAKSFLGQEGNLDIATAEALCILRWNGRGRETNQVELRFALESRR